MTRKEVLEEIKAAKELLNARMDIMSNGQQVDHKRNEEATTEGTDGILELTQVVSDLSEAVDTLAEAIITEEDAE